MNRKKSNSKNGNIERADVEKPVDRKLDVPHETNNYLNDKITSKTDEVLGSKKGSKLVNDLANAPLAKDVKIENVDRLNDVVKGVDNVDKVERFTKRAFNTIEEDQKFIDEKDSVKNNLQKYYDNKNELRFDPKVHKELTEDEKLDDKTWDSKFDDEVSKLKTKSVDEKIPSHKIT
jgi:hypothetical protein